MEEKKIRRISLEFPQTDDGTCISYEVGKKDVTEIVRREYSPEPYCVKFYYEMHSSKGIIAELHQVTWVQYFEEAK